MVSFGLKGKGNPAPGARAGLGVSLAFDRQGVAKFGNPAQLRFGKLRMVAPVSRPRGLKLVPLSDVGVLGLVCP